MNMRWADENATGIMKVLPAFEYRHPRFFAAWATFWGVILLLLTAIMYGYGRGGWWGAVLVPGAAVAFFFAHRLRALTAMDSRNGT
jgi:hypothetical protein